MKRILPVLLTALVSLSFTSCLTTKMSSFSNLDATTTYSKRIVVYACTDDIELKKTIEKDFITAFAAKKITVKSGIDLLSPLTSHTEEEICEATRDIDASYLMTVKMPADGIYAYPFVNFEVKIKDVNTNEYIYIANGHTVCDKIPEYKETSAYISKRTCADYLKFVRSAPRQEPKVETSTPSEIQEVITEEAENISETPVEVEQAESELPAAESEETPVTEETTAEITE